jgi:methylmalonyl-CoA epimerase
MDHVGVAVKSVDDAVKVYCDLLGFKLGGVQVLKDRKIKVAFISTGGETQIELVESLGSDSAIAKFLETRGEGIHHFAMKVDNIEEVLEELKQKGTVLIDEKPRLGAEGKRVAFISPKSTRGVLLELVEKT